jgi:type IV pilus assembly protein PilN
MANINLLPWREERRQERRREFLVLLVLVFAAAVGLLVLGDRIVNAQIDYQRERNDYLSGHIQSLDEKVFEIKDLQKKRQQLIERMRVIQELQGNRPIIVRILDQLARTAPDGVYYTRLQAREKQISITGVAESNNRVSSLMRRLDASDWLADPNLDQVKAEPGFGDQATRFELKVKVQLPQSPNGAEG